MRRRAGVAGLQRSALQKEQFRGLGLRVEERQVNEMREQVSVFRTNLEEFAAKHRNDINRSPDFRMHFHKMCVAIGVDPLASSKGFWAELLGVGDFYYELAVQIVEVCIATRQRNGGLVDVSELRSHLEKRRSKRGGRSTHTVSEDDIERAMKKLAVLGSGFRLLEVGSRKIIQSVPVELDRDHVEVLALAQTSGFVSEATATASLQWTSERIKRVLTLLLQEGMAWVDDQAPQRQFWFPSLVGAVGIEE